MFLLICEGKMHKHIKVKYIDIYKKFNYNIYYSNKMFTLLLISYFFFLYSSFYYFTLQFQLTNHQLHNLIYLSYYFYILHHCCVLRITFYCAKLLCHTPISYNSPPLVNFTSRKIKLQHMVQNFPYYNISLIILHLLVFLIFSSP